jgi:hypothetical protein
MGVEELHVQQEELSSNHAWPTTANGVKPFFLRLPRAPLDRGIVRRFFGRFLLL